MRLKSFVAATAVLVTPGVGLAQHSHGGGGMEMPPRQEKPVARPPERQAGVLPPGSPRQVQVLVVYFGFSPKKIPADQGEEIVLAVRRSDPAHCKEGLAIPSRNLRVELPLDETVPVTLRLDRAETIALACVDEGDDFRAAIVVAPR